MVVPFLPFVGLTVFALVRQVVTDYTANMAKKKLAKSFLIDRLDSKMEKKFGKDFLKKKLSPDNLEEVRKIIHEELAAYSPRKDLDQLIINSAQKLSNEHQQILTKLDNVESLLQKISIPLAYSLAKESQEEIPEELLIGIIEGSLQGHGSSQQVLSELTVEDQVPTTVYSVLKEFEFIKRVDAVGKNEITQLVKKFTNTREEINDLSTLMDLSTLLIGPNEELENLVSEFVFKMIQEGIDSSIIEDSVISFCFLVHRLGKLDLLSESDRLVLGSFLRKNVQKIEDPTRMLEAYFLLSALDDADDINTTFIKEILERHQEQGISSIKEMSGQLRVDGRLARFLKRIGFKTSKPEASLRNIKLLIRKLDKRKFIRSTQLLKHQLDRLITEFNLLITFFEKKESTQIDLTEIVELIQVLLEILNRPRVFELDLETKKRVIELMDAAYYLYDLIAIRNSWNLINNFQLDVKSLYSPTIGSYERITTDQASFNRALADFSRKRLRRIERDLPSPPRKDDKIKKRIN
ncbi:MAG: hypothetical protein JSW11_15615 [Candidatus Heimdallarchaeota archaeon]|nr:MAG: hypothetical protein JSW11_15615 [Candidatus Heimdallarchaeota archaeon]